MHTEKEIWIYQIDDCEWYFAKSLEQAIALYQESTLNFEPVDARAITDNEMDSLIYWDSENTNESHPEHWQCECGKTPNGYSRWNGSAWQCHHGYPIGHVDMVNIHKLTFRQKLEKDIASGRDCGFFATTEF